MKCLDCGFTPADHPPPPEGQWPYMYERGDIVRCCPCTLRSLMHEGLIRRLDPARMADVGLAKRWRR